MRTATYGSASARASSGACHPAPVASRAPAAPKAAAAITRTAASPARSHAGPAGSPSPPATATASAGSPDQRRSAASVHASERSRWHRLHAEGRAPARSAPSPRGAGLSMRCDGMALRSAYVVLGMWQLAQRLPLDPARWWVCSVSRSLNFASTWHPRQARLPAWSFATCPSGSLACIAWHERHERRRSGCSAGARRKHAERIMPLYSRPPTRTVPSGQNMLSTSASTRGAARDGSRTRRKRVASRSSPGRKVRV